MNIPKNLRVGNFSFVSQQPDIFRGPHSVLREYVAEFVPFWAALEQATGFRWKSTSWLRDSKSHAKGYALDLAPDIIDRDWSLYSVSRMSDPVLYKRTRLMRDLQGLHHSYHPRRFSVGVYVEPDHLHVHLMKSSDGFPQVRVFKWKQPKPIYKDTFERMKLPMLP